MHQLKAKIQYVKRLNQTRIDYDIELTCFPGNWSCINGPNGSGKSTLLKSLIGVIPHLRSVLDFCGSVSIDGDNFDRRYFDEMRGRIAYLPEQSWGGIVSRTVGEERAFTHASKRTDVAPSDPIRFLEVPDFTEIKKLSFGQLQRLRLERMFSSCAEIICLDEPTQGLDESGRVMLLQQLKNQSSKSIIFAATHDNDMITSCTNVVDLQRPHNNDLGEFFDSSAQSILTNIIPKKSPFTLSWNGLVIGQSDGFKYNVPDGEVKSGEILLITGANGCGKTTFQKTLSGLLRPLKGTAHLRFNGIQYAKGLFEYLQPDPSRSFLFDTISEEFNRTYTKPNERQLRKLARDILHRYLGRDVWDSNPLFLSTGQQRIVSLMLRSPFSDIFLLDEPTIGLDEKTLHGVKKYIRFLCNCGKIVIVATHDKFNESSIPVNELHFDC